MIGADPAAAGDGTPMWAEAADAAVVQTGAVDAADARKRTGAGQSAYGRALALLGRRERSRRELRDKLLAGGVAESEADATLVKLDEKGFQSDRRFADMLARSRIAQGHGPVRILAELRLHGIDTGTAQDALDEQGADWQALATALCRRRFKGVAADHAERIRRANFLARRGFPAGIARSVASAGGDDVGD